MAQRAPRRSLSGGLPPAELVRTACDGVDAGRSSALLVHVGASYGARLSESGNGLRVAHGTPIAVRSRRSRLGASTGGWFCEVGKFQSISSNGASPHSPSDAREYARSARGSRSAHPEMATATAPTSMMPARRCTRFSREILEPGDRTVVALRTVYRRARGAGERGWTSGDYVGGMNATDARRTSVRVHDKTRLRWELSFTTLYNGLVLKHFLNVAFLRKSLFGN